MARRVCLLSSLCVLPIVLPAAAQTTNDYQVSVPLAPYCLRGGFPITVTILSNQLAGTLSIATNLNGVLTGQLELDGTTFNATGSIKFKAGLAKFSLSAVNGADSLGLKGTLNGAALVGSAKGKGTIAPGTGTFSIDLSTASALDVDVMFSLLVDASGKRAGTGTASGCGQEIPLTGSATADGSIKLKLKGLGFSFSGSGPAVQTNGNTGYNVSWKAKGFGASHGGTGLFIETIGPVVSNSPPTAMDDSANATSGNAVEITVLANDSDPNGDLIGVISNTLPTHGSLSFLFDVATYTPNILFTGTDTFTYTITDSRGGTNTATVTVTVTPPPFQVVSHSPADNAAEVGVHQRPQVFFSKAVNPATLNTNNFYATALGQRLPATVVPGGNGLFAWLFFTPPMPGATEVMVTMDGASIQSAGGETLDADADGTPGGVLQFHFSTGSLAQIPGTVLMGRLVDPGSDLRPMTADDFDPGLDGQPMTGDDIFLLPIAGVKIYILGMEDHFVFTDANGDFVLAPVPSGDVKVVMDGLTATSPPAGQYFPEMVMDSHLQAGLTNTVMPGMKTMYLPRVESSILQTVNNGGTTMVTLKPEAAYDLTPEQQAFLNVQILPNSLIGTNGQPAASAQIGISVVPPELVEAMLPPGLLQHTFDITVQSLGASLFATPAPMTFPNVFDAPPGTKLNLLSFDHTTGRLVIEGTATVSADGLSVHTDPGTGITHPGWHGQTPPGGSGNGGGGGGCAGRCPKNSNPEKCKKERQLAISAGVQCGVSVAFAFVKTTPLLGCAIELVTASLASGVDCSIDPVGCRQIVAMNTLGAALGCIPVGGGVLSAGYDCLIQGSLAYDDYKNCLASAQAAAAAQIPSNPLAEQAALWAAANDLYALVFGNPKWTTLDPEDFPKAHRILERLQENLQPGSDGGNGVTQGERDAILLLARPGNLSTSDVHALIDRYVQILEGQTPAGGLDLAAVSVAASNLLEVVTILEQRGWRTTVDGYLRTMTALAEEQHNALGVTPLGAGASVLRSSHAAQADVETALVGNTFYKLTNLADGFVQRGRVPSHGRFDSLFVAPETLFAVQYVHPGDGRVATTVFRSSVSGSTFEIPAAIFVEPSSPDTDGDGLSDEAEDIIGTDPAKFSTCDDGISDLAKMQQGLDLAGCGVFPTGIIAALALPGEAMEIVLVGSTNDPGQQTAYVACGSAGLSLVNASNFQMPILLGQLALPGVATDVAVDAAWQVAIVAANNGGLHFVDVSNPMQPTLLETIHVAASQVEIADANVYVTVGADLHSYDVAARIELQTLTLGGTTLNGLAREGSFLYTMDSSQTLRAIDISGLFAVARGSLPLSNGGGKLFVGNAIAYVANEVAQPGGFATVDVSDPDNLALISGADNTSIAGEAVAANGSGLAVTVGSPGILGNFLQVLDVSDPADTAAFLAQFTLPADPSSVAIGSGIAFVADGTSGLQVVNYLPFDNLGAAPVVTLATSHTNVIEGTLLPIPFTVTDDVQVRNVELLVDGAAAQNDVSFPFELTAPLPFLSAGSSNVTVEVRATDTGGNAGTSGSILITLLPDTAPPTVVGTEPPDGGARGTGSLLTRVRFSEPLDPATVTAESVRLVLTNATVTAQSIELRHNNAEVQLRYANLGAGDYQIVLAGPMLKDRVGNALAPTNIVSHFSVSEGVIAWVNPGGGNWFTATNWQGGVLPGPGQHVIIDIETNQTVTVGVGGAASIRSLVSSAQLKLSGGTLTVAATLQVNNTFTIESGTLKDATVLPGSEGQGVTVASGGQGTLDGVTLEADVAVPNGALTILNGLTLNSKITLASTGSARLTFQGTQTLDGTGEIEFTETGCVCASVRAQLGTLTIGPDILIHGQQGEVVPENANSGKIIHQGRIIADTVVSGITGISVNGGEVSTNQSFINQGTIQATVGRIRLVGQWLTASLGTVQNSGGGVFILGTLDNTSATLALNATTGSWNLGGGNGTIRGGAITATNSAALLIPTGEAGILEGVTLNADLDVPNGFLTVREGLTLGGASLRLGLNTTNMSFSSTAVFEGTQTLGGTGEVVFAGGCCSHIYVQGNGTQGGAAALTFAPGITIHNADNGFLSASFGFDRFVNQGTISSEVAGKTIAISDVGGDTTWINEGTMQAANGGSLLVSWGSLVNAGELTPGNPPQPLNIVGTLSVGGTYTQQVGGVLHLHIGGTTPGTEFSRLNATRHVALDGTLSLALINSFEPNLGDTFEIMTFASRTGQFATVTGSDIGNGKMFQTDYTATNVVLTVVTNMAPMASVATDGTSLTVTSISPRDGDTSVPVNTVVVIQFDKPLDPSTIFDQTVRLIDWVTHQEIRCRRDVTSGSTAVLLRPAKPLQPLTTYQLHLAREITDQSGNPLTDPVEAFFLTSP